MLLSLLIIPIISIGLTSIRRIQSFEFINIIGSILNLGIGLYLLLSYDFNNNSYQFILYNQFAIDSISIWFVILTTFIAPLVFLSYSSSITTNNRLFFILLNSVFELCYIVFLTLDILVFYIGFEAILIPMFLLILFFGSRNKKVDATYYFIFYTLIGGLFMLSSIIALICFNGTSNLLYLSTYQIHPLYQKILWLGIFIGCAIKIPLYPFHLWLPQAHVEANTSGSVVLAAILLKLGIYGILRLLLPYFENATEFYLPLVYTLCIIGLIYSSLICLTQFDLKRIIAYSSVSHMGVCTLALFSMNTLGILTSIYFCISHGLISGALFFLIGFLYERYHSRNLKYYRGLVSFLPLFSTCLIILNLANAGIPSSSGFLSEFFSFICLFMANPFIAILAGLSIVLTPGYSLYYYHKILYGKTSPYLSVLFTDLSKKELFIISILIIGTFLLGLYPNLLIHINSFII